MIPNVVPNAGRQEKQNALAELMDTDSSKDSRQPVLNAAKKPKYHLSLEKADRYIVAIATVLLGRANR